ncbi:tetratricopeptide repeat protein [Streptomyces sp. NPDC099088]|uniref:tetratricopeptide repeat protein n=1 Tax=Streptomyces sp. NPDC099088 TaxID=3366101 RepID=UPI0037FB87DA
MAPSEAALREAIVQRRHQPGERVRLQIKLARIWREQGDYARAGLLLSFTLPAAERWCGTDSLEVAATCNEWGVVGKYAGSFDRSKNLYHRALVILQHNYGHDHDSVASVCHNLGGLAHVRGEYREGEPWAARSVRIRSRLHGPDHPTVAGDRTAWAALLDGCDRLDEAEDELQKALRVLRQANTGPSYDIAVILQNLAAIHHRRGAIQDAIRGYERALAAKKTVVGPAHPGLAPTLISLASAYGQAGDSHQAIEHYTQAIQVLQPQTAADHPHLLSAQRGLQRYLHQS